MIILRFYLCQIRYGCLGESDFISKLLSTLFFQVVLIAGETGCGKTTQVRIHVPGLEDM